MGLRLRTIFIGLLLFCSNGWGWGSYGHEQINRAAAMAISNQPIGKWLNKNLLTVQRLSVTPDYDWKKVGTPPTDPKLVELRNLADRYEHPLHYFEVDAFLFDGVVDPTTLKLLGLDIYGKVYPSYAKMRAENEKYVVSIDAEKALKDADHPTAKEVTSHGTSPWRIAQLWKLGVNAIKNKNYALGLSYLGAMGHYVGDCAQPFHGTLDYDGAAHVPDAEGIHAAYETKSLEILAKAKGSTWDKDAKLWQNFAATEAAVVKATVAKMEKLPAIQAETHAGIAGPIIQMMGSTHAAVTPLEDVFAEAILEENEGAQTIRVETIKAFMKKSVAVGANAQASVTSVALDELANGAALLAKLWVAAQVALASEPGLDLAKLPNVKFSEYVVLENYPKPTYLPQLAEDPEESLEPTLKGVADRAKVKPPKSRSISAQTAAKPKPALFGKNRRTGDAHEPPKP